MFSRYFSAVFDGFSRRRGLAVGLATIITLGAGIGLETISLENDVALMLPGDDEILRTIRFVQESHFSDDLVISLEAKSSDRPSQELHAAVARLEGDLGPPLVSDVVSGVSRLEVMDETLAFLKHVPELTDEGALTRIGSQITPEGVAASLRRNFRQLVSPASTFMVPFVRSDPLGIGADLLRSLQRLSTSLGYEIEIEDGHFVSRDGTHALFIVQTPITVTDASGARELVTYLREKLAQLPDTVSADIIGGHLHTVSNEDVIKRDIWLALGIASVAFLLLFLFLFRDVRAVVLFLIPLASVVVAINVSNIVVSRLSYFIVGMGGVVAGISVDYGIHVYMAVRSSNGRADAVKLVAKPVVTGALTTLGVFVAFFFSSVEGYHQLAFFSIFSIVLCLASSLFLLPHFLSRAPPEGSDRTFAKHGFGRFEDQAGVVIACWVLAVAAGLVSATRLTFDSDIRQFDGSEPHILRAENEFHRVWGGRDRPAVFVVPGEDLDGALRRNRLVYRDALNAIGDAEFSSLSAIWPLAEERAENTERWREFWKQGREAELKKLLREYGAAYGFADDAFSPFFDNLYPDPVLENALGSLAVFSRLRERFVEEGQNGYQVLSFFPDEDGFVARLSAISERHPGTFLVSRKALARALSRSISSEIVYLSAIAAVLIPILAGLLLRNIRLTALSLVPVATGIVAVLGAIPVLGLSLNAPSVISAMVVVGLCVDYGIFVVYACHHELETGTHTAVTLSAVTTLIGTGVLLFARHPILFSIGATMVTGVLAGYVSAVLVVPSLYQRFGRRVVEPR